MRQMLKDFAFFSGTSIAAAFLLVTCTIPVQAEPEVSMTGLFCPLITDLERVVVAYETGGDALLDKTIEPLLRRYECLFLTRDSGQRVRGFIVFYGRTFVMDGTTFQIVGIATSETGEAEVYSFIIPPEKPKEREI